MELLERNAHYIRNSNMILFMFTCVWLLCLCIAIDIDERKENLAKKRKMYYNVRVKQIGGQTYGQN